ncbi:MULTISPECIES: inovirus-type Gp2 protein [unclassified Desulfovibrio]|uniref:YagK/YfjJ domain-containing protein n=1 Tax=unclassified Desulfovibrio TaxID=2593640 RepID=UPI0013EA055F|nr:MULTISPECIES: inovirus-type Gp2 protein [unclassified Desulfovibrio]
METTIEETYRGYRINTGENNNLPCNIKTLDQYIDILEYMEKMHSRVLSVRLDIHTPIDSEVPLRKKMTRILESTKRNLESKNNSNNKVDMHYVWTAERTAQAAKEHVHLDILVNGNITKNGYGIFKTLEKVVKRQIPDANDGLVEFCKSNGEKGIFIDRNDPHVEDKRNEATYAASYLAKASSKEYKAKGARFSSASRLPSNWR